MYEYDLYMKSGIIHRNLLIPADLDMVYSNISNKEYEKNFVTFFINDNKKINIDILRIEAYKLISNDKEIKKDVQI
jgi:hypothetical protein